MSSLIWLGAAAASLAVIAWAAFRLSHVLRRRRRGRRRRAAVIDITDRRG